MSVDDMRGRVDGSEGLLVVMEDWRGEGGGPEGSLVEITD